MKTLRSWAARGTENDPLTLKYYPRGARMDFHTHDVTQITAVLAGALIEETHSRKVELTVGATGCKPAGFSHATEIAHVGALLITQSRDHIHSDAWSWQRSSTREIAPTLRRILRGEQVDCLPMAAEPELFDRPTPSWLRHARRNALQGDFATVAEMALKTGVDRSYLSRTFSRAFGVSPSVFLAHMRLARAVSHLLEDLAPVSSAAMFAGFSDQAHLTRTMKSQLGVTPGQLRSFMSI